jgi:hypothetical protein
MKVATVEQQQWTDCIHISNTVDSAGAFRVAAAATADGLFCLDILISYYKKPIEKIGYKMFEISLRNLCLHHNRK